MWYDLGEKRNSFAEYYLFSPYQSSKPDFESAQVEKKKITFCHQINITQ